jgi:hypothetical protein
VFFGPPVVNGSNNFMSSHGAPPMPVICPGAFRLSLQLYYTLIGENRRQLFMGFYYAHNDCLKFTVLVKI